MKNSNAVYYHQFNQEELKEALQGLYGEGIFKKKEEEKKVSKERTYFQYFLMQVILLLEEVSHLVYHSMRLVNMMIKTLSGLKKLNNMKEENSNPSIRYNATTSYRPNVLYIGTLPPLEIKKYERRRLK
jgi:hypothetical protein